MLIQNRIFTTEARRTQREVFVCREIPTNKNILLQDPPRAGLHAFGEVFFVYRYLPIDEKINLPLCVLCASVVNLVPAVSSAEPEA